MRRERGWLTTSGPLPPIVERNASASGTDVAGYLTESPGFTAFVLEDGVVLPRPMRPGGAGSSS